MMNHETNITEKPNKGDKVSPRQLVLLRSLSFATLVAALLEKSENAQCTFIYRYLDAAPGEVLTVTNKYAEMQIKKRAKANIAKKG